MKRRFSAVPVRYRPTVRLLLFLVAFLVASVGAFAGDALLSDMYPKALGGFAGPLGGTGLSYQQWNGPSGFQVAGGITYSSDSSSFFSSWDNLLAYSVGAEYQHRVYGENFRPNFAGILYLFGGANHSGRIPWEYSYDNDGYYDESEAGDYIPEFGIGGGFGTEMILWHLSVSFEIGYGAFWAIDPDKELMDQIGVGPIPQVAARYRY